MRAMVFLHQFLKYPREVGTITQSSRALARKMAEEIDGSTTVVEFGSGTGPVTEEILKRLPDDGRLICFEINPVFCKQLEKIDDPRLQVINDDAGNCERYVDNFDCVVSGLPLALFPKSQKEKILDITSRGKRFIQLQYTPLLKKKMRSYFTEVKVKFVARNLPPAFVFVCEGSNNNHPRPSGNGGQ